MKIPLKEFEQHIDETIFKRGYQYYKKGLVQEPVEISNGEYEAIVEGTENYTVELSIKNGVVTEHVCSCPYDMGPVCKHEVAVMFYLQKDELDISVSKKKSTKGTTKAAPKKTVAEQINDILNVVSHEKLQDYIKEYCEKNVSFRQLFLADFAYLVMKENKAMYAKKVKAILHSVSHRGYIGYSEARFVGKATIDLIESAEKHVESGNYKSAFYIACAVLEEMTKALDYSDDSNGDIGGCIDYAREILFTLATKDIDEDLRIELLEYCTTAFENEIYKGWDWHFSMLDLASELILNKEEADKIHSLLDTIKSSGKSWDYHFEEAQRIRLQLITKIDGEAKANQFLETNITNSDFRKKIIENAIASKDYTKAIKLAEEGIKLNEKEYPGLADNWREYLLKVYLLLNDKDNIIKYAKYLFLNSNRERKYYFTLLKENVLPENWDSYLQLLIKEKTQSSRWVDTSFIAQIYIWEEQWDKLFEIVKKDISLNNLDTYEKYLINDYAKELTDFYQKAILKYMENNMGRDHYQAACRYIRKLIKMGAREKADYVVLQLKSLYPKRKALIEELGKI